MKRLLTLIITFTCMLCDQLSYAQTVSIVYSFGGNDLFSSTSFVGGPSYSGKGFYGSGVHASMEVYKNLSIVTGFSYEGNRFAVTPAPTGAPTILRYENINVFSVPLYIKYHFLKFLYVSGGPVFSINSGDQDLNGIGAAANFGAEYLFKNGLVLSFGPSMRIHGLVPWKHYRLINSGVNLGIGYRF